MPNSIQLAEQWLKFICAQHLPLRDVFTSHIAAGDIDSFCTCGCNGFGFSVPQNVGLQPLSESSGLFCELAFRSNFAEEIDILLFTDERGYFAGAHVTYGFANSGPMPEGIRPVELIGIWPSDNLAKP